eukprot:COSAG05_NODE_573_length_8601_cov_58.330981_11_plen_97_part_00
MPPSPPLDWHTIPAAMHRVRGARTRRLCRQWPVSFGAHRRPLSSSSSSGSKPWFTHAGEGAVLLRFGTSIDTDVNKRVLACLRVLDSDSGPVAVSA